MPKSKPSRPAAYPAAADLAILIGTAAKLKPVQIRTWMRRRKFKEQVKALVALAKEYAS